MPQTSSEMYKKLLQDNYELQNKINELEEKIMLLQVDCPDKNNGGRKRYKRTRRKYKSKRFLP